MKNIAIPYAIYPEALDYIREYAKVDCFQDQITQEEFLPIADRYDAIINRGFSVRLNKELIDKAANLKVIGVCKVGLDDVAVDEAKKRGIQVFNCGPCSANAVAELTMLHLLNLSRNFMKNLNLAHCGRWKEKSPFGSFELSGRTLGIIGFGQVGRRVAELARCFQMDVLAYDPWIADQKKVDIPIVSLEELLPRCDYITIHCPLTEQTRGMFDSVTINKMKKGACLINMGRGGIVDEEALYHALLQNQLAGAGLDVLSNEPMEKGYKLSELDCVYITPHVGDAAENTQRRIAMYVANQVLKALGCI